MRSHSMRSSVMASPWKKRCTHADGSRSDWGGVPRGSGASPQEEEEEGDEGFRCGGGGEEDQELAPGSELGPLAHLPRYLLQHILFMLPGEGEGGVCAARAVCRSWKAAVDEAGDRLWQEVFQRQFGPNITYWSVLEQRYNPKVDGAGTWAERTTWRRRYRERIVAGRNWLKGTCRHWRLPDEESVQLSASFRFHVTLAVHRQAPLTFQTLALHHITCLVFVIDHLEL